MSFLTIILTGFALAMAAFAVSITKGMTLKDINLYVASKIGFSFGLYLLEQSLQGH